MKRDGLGEHKDPPLWKEAIPGAAEKIPGDGPQTEDEPLQHPLGSLDLDSQYVMARSISRVRSKLILIPKLVGSKPEVLPLKDIWQCLKNCDPCAIPEQ